MDLIRVFIAIFRFVTRWFRGDDDDDEPESNPGQRYHYSEIRGNDNFRTNQPYQITGETRTTTVTPPFTTQSQVSKPTSHRIDFPASLSHSTSAQVSSISPSVRFPPPPPVTAHKPTATTSTGISEVPRQAKPFAFSPTKPTYSLPASQSSENKFLTLSNAAKPTLSSPQPSPKPTGTTSTGLSVVGRQANPFAYSTTNPSYSLPPLPAPQSSQNKLTLSNAAKPTLPSPQPSPKPTSPVPSPIQKKPSLSTKPALRMDSAKNSYILVEEGASPTYAAPDDLKRLIVKEIVPQVLKHPLSISTYKDYFRALLYAEDIYIEKWDGFEMKDITLELHDAAIYKRRSQHNKFDEDDRKHKMTFVAFEIDKIPEKRPFLLSRDFVTIKPSKNNFTIFEGLVHRVVRSNLLLSEFGDDFLYQHHPTRKYDVKFSFNRVCLKRAHQAIESASAPLFRNFLFPEILPESRLLSKQYSVIDKILRLRASPPYLVTGQLSVMWDKKSLSGTGNLVVNAVVELVQASPLNRILLCAPANKTCDLLLRGLKWRQRIPEHDIFRANAAFREWEEVPEDILTSCTYEDETECFFCPSLDELRRYKVILSTFMSSHRLHTEGVKAGHFSHVILVDGSSVTEPEALVPLANFATEGTAVVVFGAPGNHSGWTRSPMARKFGLACSYFERLCDSKLYESLDPNLITVLNDDDDRKSHG